MFVRQHRSGEGRRRGPGGPVILPGPPVALCRPVGVAGAGSSRTFTITATIPA